MEKQEIETKWVLICQRGDKVRLRVRNYKKEWNIKSIFNWLKNKEK